MAKSVPKILDWDGVVGGFPLTLALGNLSVLWNF
jgi:hypothetical protein